tara:strand:+ start:448 stop:633 length:186 start_codon:yes stop_codon:yes gene_type:complete
MGWFLWEQNELIAMQREEIRKKDEVIIQMDKLIETQFQYIEKFVTPRYNKPQEESPIYKSI